ncbi:MAG: hypothetical protein IMX02_01405 [Limnochordaceae bacterium]|nr:hypothetical protein [Limnochordaceae bacterium]
MNVVELLRNGAFTEHHGWSLGENCEYVPEVPGGGPGLMSLGADPTQKQMNGESEHAGAATQWGFIPEGCERLELRGHVRLDSLHPYTGRGNVAHLTRAPGHLYVRLAQLDLSGDPVDEATVLVLREPGGWQQVEQQLPRNPKAWFFELRIGIYNGTGRFWVKAFSLRARGAGLDAVSSWPPLLDDRAVAIFYDPSFPGAPQESRVFALLARLKAWGWQVASWNAAALERPDALTGAGVSLLIWTHGPHYPAHARAALLRFLAAGGKLMTLGGYAFDRIWRREAEGWVEQPYPPQVELDGAPVVAPLESTVESLPTRRDGEAQGYLLKAHPFGSFLQAVPQAEALYELEAGSWYVLVVEGRGEGLDYFWQPVVTIEQLDASGEVLFRFEARLLERAGGLQVFRMPFKTHYRQARTRLRFGLKMVEGAYVLRRYGIVPIPDPGLLNGRWGLPSDGILLKPTQLGLFDADFRLEHAVTVRPAGSLHLLDAAGWTIAPPDGVRGWAATGLTRVDDARWEPLLEASDRYGQERGPAAALVIHRAGPYTHSAWAAFGTENIDLLDERRLPGLCRVAAFLAEGLFLQEVRPHHYLARRGEDALVDVIVHNTSGKSRAGSLVVWCLDGAGTILWKGQQQVAVPARATRKVTFAIPWAEGKGTLRTIRSCLRYSPEGMSADLRAGDPDEPWDVMESSILVESQQALECGPRLQFRDNYFELDGRRVVLMGSDSNEEIFFGAFHHPARRRRLLLRARDYGYRVYENLQYIPGGFQFPERQQRSLDALVQELQQLRMIYMPCLLVLTNVLAQGAEREAQQEFCRRMAAHWRDVPGLIFYFNGDLGSELHPLTAFQGLWEEYLRRRYGLLDRLQEAWGPAYDPSRGWSQALPDGPDPVWNPLAPWDDVRLRDRVRFVVELGRLWNRSMVDAVSSVTPGRITTDEFFNLPFGANDLRQAIDGLTHANGNALGDQDLDVDLLPGAFTFIDRRIRGQGTGLGEYGCKTHPSQAWGANYLVRRTREEQLEHFLAVQHYGLGRGASKLQHWGLQDSTGWVFPWGVFHSHDPVPKPIAAEVRNVALLFATLPLAYRAPRVVLVVPSENRMGPGGIKAVNAVYAAGMALSSLGCDFQAVDEEDLATLPFEPRVVLYPVAYGAPATALEWLRHFARRGGTVYLSGDPSYDEDRKPRRESVWEDLIGARLVRRLYPPMQWEAGPAVRALIPGTAVEDTWRPCVHLELAGARALVAGEGGFPVVTRRPAGDGTVIYNADPTEARWPGWRSSPVLFELYRAVVGACVDGEPPVSPQEPDLHVMTPAAEGGRLWVLFHRSGSREVEVRPGEGQAVRLHLERRRPGLVFVTSRGELTHVESQGTVTWRGRPLVEASAHLALVALDGQDLSRSEAVLALPFTTGTVWRWPGAGDTVVVGTFRDGQWVELEKMPATGEPLEVDEVRAGCMFLVAAGHQLPQWRRRLSAYCVSGYFEAGPGPLAPAGEAP